MLSPLLMLQSGLIMLCSRSIKLAERENYIKLHRRYENWISAGATPLSAIIELDREHYPVGPRREHTQFSQLEHLQVYNTILPRGQPWDRIVQAATCLDSILLNERCYIGHPTNIIGPIIENGCTSFVRVIVLKSRIE
jgi:hypothetical protein